MVLAIVCLLGTGVATTVFFANNAVSIPGTVSIWQLDTNSPPGQQVSSYYEPAGQVGYNFVAGGVTCGDGNYYTSGNNFNDNLMLQAALASAGGSPSEAQALPSKYNYFNLWCHPTNPGALLGVAYVGTGFGLVVYSPNADPPEKVIGTWPPSDLTDTGTAFSLSPDGSEVWGNFPSPNIVPQQQLVVLSVESGQVLAIYQYATIMGNGAPYFLWPASNAKDGAVAFGAYMRAGGFEPSEIYCANFTFVGDGDPASGSSTLDFRYPGVACPQFWSSSQPGRDCGDGLYTMMANGGSSDGAITSINMTTLQVVSQVTVAAAAPGTKPEPGGLAC